MRPMRFSVSCAYDSLGALVCVCLSGPFRNVPGFHPPTRPVSICVEMSVTRSALHAWLLRRICLFMWVCVHLFFFVVSAFRGFPCARCSRERVSACVCEAACVGLSACVWLCVCVVLSVCV